MEARTLIIVGAGGFGREVFQWALDQIESGNASYSKIQFVDDMPANPSFSEVYQNFREPLASFSPGHSELVVIAIADCTTRRAVAERLKESGAQFGSVIHPSAIIARNAVHNEGLILCPYSCLSANSVIGSHVHINCGSTIGHDSVLGGFVTVSSHVDIMGNCAIEDDVFFGSGARVLPKCKVANGSSVGAGVTIQRSVKVKSVLYQLTTKKMGRIFGILCLVPNTQPLRFNCNMWEIIC